MYMIFTFFIGKVNLMSIFRDRRYPEDFRGIYG